MKVLLGCDVDPVLPPVLAQPPKDDIWACLDDLAEFVEVRRQQLPPITWLIRSDESVRFSTGDFTSGYVTRRQLWQRLQQDGHELGWHVHLTSFDQRRRCFGFDPDPSWFAAAFQALSKHFDIQATRIGWDFASSLFFQKLEALGIKVDFSALPGNIVWQQVGYDKLRVDWLRCPREPYHPKWDDYQCPGAMDLLEIPITQFSNSTVGIAKRIAWRIKNGSFSVSGLRNKTKLFTEYFGSLPTSKDEVWSFYFHPDDLKADGKENFMRNLDLLRSLPNVEFITASAARQFVLRNRGQGATHGN
jgi:hypothetical protein